MRSADVPTAACGSNPWYCPYEPTSPLCCQSKEVRAVSSDWEGAFLSKEEVETVKALIGDWGFEYSLTAQRAQVRALGRRLGMPDMGTE